MLKKLLLSVCSIFTYTQTYAQTYCAQSFTTVEAITNVTFNTINNNLASSSGYVNNTSISTSVFQGQSYTISVNGNTDGNYTNYISVFIDFNKNGSFEDTGERFDIGSLLNNDGTGTPVTNTITIPTTASTGSTRMRVIKNFNSNITSSCTAGSYGQTVDYTINIGSMTPCQGPPASIELTTQDLVVCDSKNFTLSHNVTLTYGYIYNWEKSIDNGTSWQTISTTDSNLTTSTATPAMYRLKVTCENSTTTSNTISVTLKPYTECYCTPTINFNCTDGDLITNVVFSNISNPTQCGNTVTGYTYFSNLTANVTKGSQYTFSATVGGGWTYESVAVAIDYNQNGIFEQDEILYIGTGSNSTVTNTITIPATALSGITRLRVYLMASTAESFQTNLFELVCGPISTTEFFGEIEDYNINIEPTASLQDFVSNNITLYPNPAVTELFINTTDALQIQNVSIFSITGQLVYSKKLNQASHLTQIDVNTLNSGIYLIKIETDKGTTTQKFTKK